MCKSLISAHTISTQQGFCVTLPPVTGVSVSQSRRQRGQSARRLRHRWCSDHTAGAIATEYMYSVAHVAAEECHTEAGGR